VTHNEFLAAMTDEDFLAGETRHQEAEPSRKLSMAAGLTKSSEELNQTWKTNPELYLMALKGAISAFEENENVKELLVGSIARLVSVIDTDDDEISNIVDRAMEIIGEDSDTAPH
jgi:hypothetical protein